MLRIGGRTFDLVWAGKRAGVERRMERSSGESALACERDCFPSHSNNESTLLPVFPPAEYANFLPWSFKIYIRGRFVWMCPGNRGSQPPLASLMRAPLSVSSSPGGQYNFFVRSGCVYAPCQPLLKDRHCTLQQRLRFR